VTVDIDPIEYVKQGAKMIWSLGDYNETSARLLPVAEDLAETCRPGPGMRVLDTAAGNGNFAVAAARRGAEVVAADITPAMVEMGMARSSAEGLAIEWQEADAEAMPFGDASFDLVASVMGVMYAPRPDVVTSELFRLTRPGGMVALANWTSDGFSAHWAELISRYAPPLPMAMPKTHLWGDAVEVRRRLESWSSSVDIEPKVVAFDFESIDDAIDRLTRSNGGMIMSQNMLPPERFAELKADLRVLVERFAHSRESRLALENRYLLVTARKRL
jgi:ubiquinone/menaquinone biosynthesis C-methylase UbiE